MDSTDTTFHLSQPPELFARADQEPVADEFGESIIMTTLGSVVNWGRKVGSPGTELEFAL